MTEEKQKQLGKTLWAIADQLRGAMDADDFRDYMLSFLFLRYLSDNYEAAAKKELGSDYPDLPDDVLRATGVSTPLQAWYEDNLKDVPAFEKQMRRKVHYVIEPLHLWSSIAQLARQQSIDLLNTLQAGFKYIETESFQSTFQGLFSEIDLASTKLGKSYVDRNAKLCAIVQKIAEGLADFSTDIDALGDAYEYLIGQFAAGSGKKAGEFYTPTAVSRLLAKLAAPKPGNTICDPACGSGSLLIRAAEEVGSDNFALYGQEVNGATWALARMNMFLHSKDAARIEWCDTLNSPTLIEGAHLMRFDVVVANPPFSLDKWGAENAASDQYSRFWRGIPPKSKGDYGFLTHMIEIAKRQSGRVAVIVPHGVLFRGGAEGTIRKALIEENLLDAVVGLPANLFTTTGIPVAILIFDRSREQGGINEVRNDVLFIDASKDFTPGKTQNVMDEAHVARVLDTYAQRAEIARYSHRDDMTEIAENDFNLNIPRYVDTFEAEEEIDVAALQRDINRIEQELAEVRVKMAGHLKELGINA